MDKTSVRFRLVRPIARGALLSLALFSTVPLYAQGTCPHGKPLNQHAFTICAGVSGSGSSGSYGGTVTDILRQGQERRDRWAQQERELAEQQATAAEAREERRWQQQMENARREAEVRAQLAAATEAKEKERLRQELISLQNSKVLLTNLAAGINLGPAGGGPGPANPYDRMASGLALNPTDSPYLFQPVQQPPSATFVAPSGVIVDRDGYLVENLSQDAADRAYSAEQAADRRREENVRADWERMQKKALRDWQEGVASGSLTWDDHPAKHGSSPEQQARYWTELRQRVDENTVKSLAGTGYDLAKVKSDARDWADRYEQTHLRQTMTEYSEPRPWLTKTITEAERDEGHLREIAEIRKGIDERLGSRPAFGPGSNEK